MFTLQNSELTSDEIEFLMLFREANTSIFTNNQILEQIKLLDFSQLWLETKRNQTEITLSLAYIIPAFEKFIQSEDRKLQFEGALIIAFYAKQINKLKELIRESNNLSAEENKKINSLTEILSLISVHTNDLNIKFKYLYKHVPTIIGNGYTKKFELTQSQENFLTAFKKNCNINLFKQLMQRIDLSIFSFKIYQEKEYKQTPELIILDFNILLIAFDLFTQAENKKQQFHGACVIAYYGWQLFTYNF